MNKFAQILSVASLIAVATISRLVLPTIPVNAVLSVDSSNVATGTSRVVVDNNSGYITASGGLRSPANNVSDLFSVNAAGKNGYFAGTVSTTNITVQNSTSTGVSEQGAFVTQPDAGSIMFLNCLASSTAGTKVGCSFAVGGRPLLGIKAVADGIGYGAASSSSYGVEFFAPLVLYSGATTTITTSTLISLTDARVRVISSNPTTSTCPQQLFATTTADLPDGTVRYINGTSSTQMLVVSDSCTTDVNTTFGGVSKTGYFGPGDVSIFMWMKNMNKWRPVDPSPFIWK